MRFDPTLLQNVAAYNGSNQVFLGNVKSLLISSVGNSQLSTSSSPLKLNNILFVPEYKENLLSIRRLVQDNNCVFECFPWGYYIKDLTRKKIMLTRPIRGGICLVSSYDARNQRIQEDFAFSNRVEDSSTNNVIWHRRLGHPSNNALSLLTIKNFISMSNSKLRKQVCDACQLGKIQRLPFLSSDRSSEHLFDLVHCDNWGPSPTLSVLGFKCYVIFVDDKSRYTWLYPMK